jgi:RNA polymerase sigma factor (sigma-70 family)
MPEANDHELLARFARENSETAFAALVGRHVALVYSVALRRTSNPPAAEEITQAVFIILARKAKNLSAKIILSGWLHQTAQLTAANYLRAEIRRRKHEHEAFMQTILTESDNSAGDEIWRQLAPHLDEAISKLRAQDRDALILRYFENKNLREIGAALGVEERAAQKRVNRAVEKLRHYFSKRGIALTTAILAGTISANSVHAAPIGLATTIAATAVKGSTVAATTLTLVKGTMKMMTWMKIKFAVGVGAAVLLAGGAATVAISQTNDSDKLTVQEIAKQSQNAYAALSSYSDTGTVVTISAGQTLTTTFAVRLQRPNLYRLEWTSHVGLYNSKGAAWSDGTGNFFQMGAVGQNTKLQKMYSMQQAFASAMGVSGSAASIPATFFKQPFGDVLGVPALGRSQLKRNSDEKIGNVDCFVISSTLPPIKLPNNTGISGTTMTTLWIGKQDHLIHQIQQTAEGMSITPPRETDSDIKTILERQNKPATPENIAALRAELEKSMKLAQNGKFVFIQTHENISVNQKFSPSDFAP